MDGGVGYGVSVVGDNSGICFKADDSTERALVVVGNDMLGHGFRQRKKNSGQGSVLLLFGHLIH